MSNLNSDNHHEIVKGQCFFTYTLDGSKIIFHQDSIIKVQIGRGRQAYDTSYSFAASEFPRALITYNAINICNGYKKRLICDTLNKPLLARYLS